MGNLCFLRFLKHQDQGVKWDSAFESGFSFLKVDAVHAAVELPAALKYRGTETKSTRLVRVRQEAPLSPFTPLSRVPLPAGGVPTPLIWEFSVSLHSLRVTEGKTV